MPQNMTNVTIAVTAMPVEKKQKTIDNVLRGLSKYEEVAVRSDILKSTAAKTKSSFLHM